MRKLVVALYLLLFSLVCALAQIGPSFNPMMATVPFSLIRSGAFVAASNQFLTRTLTTPVSSLKWTLSVWINRASTSGSGASIFEPSAATATFGRVAFLGSNYGSNSPNKIGLCDNNTGSTVSVLDNNTTGDTGVWHHFLIAYDSTQATAANRVRIFKDAVEVTYAAGAVYPVQNTDVGINTAIAHQIGKSYTVTSSDFDGKLADLHFVDGLTLAPSSFVSGSGSGTTRPILFTGSTLGTNGFWQTYCAPTIGDDSGLRGQCGNLGANPFANNNTVTASTDVPK